MQGKTAKKKQKSAPAEEKKVPNAQANSGPNQADTEISGTLFDQENDLEDKHEVEQTGPLTMEELAEPALDRDYADNYRDASFPLREHRPNILNFLTSQVRIPIRQRKRIIPMLEHLLDRAVNASDNADFYNAFLDVVEEDPPILLTIAITAVEMPKNISKTGNRPPQFEKFAPVSLAFKSYYIDESKLEDPDQLYPENFSDSELTGLLFNYGIIYGAKVQAGMLDKDIEGVDDEEFDATPAIEEEELNQKSKEKNQKPAKQIQAPKENKSAPPKAVETDSQIKLRKKLTENLANAANRLNGEYNEAAVREIARLSERILQWQTEVLNQNNVSTLWSRISAALAISNPVPTSLAKNFEFAEEKVSSLEELIVELTESNARMEECRKNTELALKSSDFAKLKEFSELGIAIQSGIDATAAKIEVDRESLIKTLRIGKLQPVATDSDNGTVGSGETHKSGKNTGDSQDFDPLSELTTEELARSQNKARKLALIAEQQHEPKTDSPKPVVNEIDSPKASVQMADSQKVSVQKSGSSKPSAQKSDSPKTAAQKTEASRSAKVSKSAAKTAAPKTTNQPKSTSKTPDAVKSADSAKSTDSVKPAATAKATGTLKATGTVKTIAAGETSDASESEATSETNKESENTSNLPITKQQTAQVIADLINQDRFSIACRFGQALEFCRLEPIIHWTSMDLVACSQISFESYDSSTQSFDALIPLAEQHSQTNEHANALIFGALLKPAILQPSLMARTTIGRLGLKSYGNQLGELSKRISSLDYAYQPTLDFLAKSAGRQEVPRIDRVTHNLLEWLATTRKRNAPCLHSTKIMHNLTGAAGEFAMVVDAIRNGKPNAKESAANVIARYKEHSEIKIRIREFLPGYKFKTREILAAASMNHLYRIIDEGRDLLSQWIDASDETKSSPVDDAAVQKNITQQLISVAGNTAEELKSISQANDPLKAAIVSWLVRKVDDLLKILHGTSIAAKNSIQSARSDDLDLLPVQNAAQFREYDPDETEDIEKINVDELAIVEFLKSNPVPDVERAIAIHSKNGAFRRAIRLLDQITDSDLQLKLKPAINKGRIAKIDATLERVAEISSKLREVGKIDLSSPEEIRRDIEYVEDVRRNLLAERNMDIDAIETSLAADMLKDLSSVSRMLDTLGTKSDSMRADIRNSQRDRLNNLKDSKPHRARDIDKLLDQLNQSTLAYNEDQIANIRDDRDIRSYKLKLEKHFEKFCPDFILQSVEKKWPKDRKSYARAFETNKVLATGKKQLASARKLMQTWFDLADAPQDANSSATELKALLQELKFRDVKINSPVAKQSDSIWQYSCMLNLPTDANWFIPPIFGSRSNGNYNILVAKNPGSLADVLAFVDKAKPNLVIHTGKLSVELRTEFAVRARKNLCPLLLIDELLLAYVASNQDDRLETLFDCALPFGRIAPYTTNPGRIPPEIFFGRKQEISQIVRPDSEGILVYGGRQLGKSTLLGKVAELYSDPPNDFIVFREDIKLFGTPVLKSNEIWKVIAENLQRYSDAKFEFDNFEAKTVIAEIDRWIKEQPNRRLLCLFDETDNFLASESKTGFPNLIQIKSLMEDTNWSFKVVFAGLHHVQRMDKSVNSPLAHLGSAICVGPMNATMEDRQDAYRLVVEPLRACGFKFEDKNIPDEILTFVNFYPSLIQVYLKHLLEHLYSIANSDSAGPLWPIKRSVLFEGKRFEEFEQEVRRKFNYTLDLDPRYKLIVNVLGLLKYQGKEMEVLRDGIHPKSILAETKAYWSKKLEKLSLLEIQTILDEMVDLGILGKIPKKDSVPYYCLRTRQVANMLGTQDEVEDALLVLGEIEPPLDYDPIVHRRFLGEIGSIRDRNDAQEFSPLTDAQLNELISSDRHVGIRFVAGIQAFGLDNVESAIEQIATSASFDPRGDNFDVHCAQSEKQFANAIRNKSRIASKTKIVVYKPDAENLESVLSFSETLATVNSGKVRPILLLDVESEHLRNVAKSRENETVVIKPWGSPMIRTYLQMIEELDNQEIRETVLKKTGGIPDDVARFFVEIRTKGTQSADSFAVQGLRISEFLQENPNLLTAIDILAQTEALTDKNEDENMAELYDVANGDLQKEIGIDLRTIGDDLSILGMLDQFDAKRKVFMVSYFGNLVCNLMGQGS